MKSKKYLLEMIKHLEKADNVDELFSTLNIILNLYNELDNFKGAYYFNKFKFDKLSITVEFGKY